MSTENMPSYDPHGNELSIFVSNADIRSTDIDKMSDFIGMGIKKLADALVVSETHPIVDVHSLDIPAAGEALSLGRVLTRNGYEYVLDYDSLPKDVLAKFCKGIYTLGESRQVEGNMRAVVVDEAGTRVKDITLKKVQKTADTSALMQGLAIQSQLKHISQKLDGIIELQDYHIELTRNHNIVAPFLNARDQIVLAQNEQDKAKQREYLDKAISYLQEGINDTCLDIKSLSKRIMLLTAPPIRLGWIIDKYIGYVADDLKLLAMYNGVLMQVLGFIGKYEDRNNAYMRYRDSMLEFCTKNTGKKRQPLSIQFHNAFSYNKQNLDTWLTMTEEIVPSLQSDNTIEGAFVISMEDDQDEEQ